MSFFMDELTQLWHADWVNFLFTVLCLFLLWDKLITIKDKICKRYGWKTKSDHETEMIQTHDEQIDNLETNLNTINNTINAVSDMIVELRQTVVSNYEDNKREHESFRLERQKDQVSLIGDKLFQAYAFYKSRAEHTGVFEWTCIEKAGFYSLMDNYHKNGGDTYSHSDIEPYMRQFQVTDPENANPNDIYFNR